MKLIFLSISLLISISSVCQFKTTIRIKSVAYKKDKKSFEKDNKIVISFSSISEITPIASLKTVDIGIKIEILPSSFYEENSYIGGIAYYKKTKNGEWELITNFSHNLITLEKDDSAINEILADSFNEGYSTGSEPNYDFAIKCRIYHQKTVSQ